MYVPRHNLLSVPRHSCHSCHFTPRLAFSITTIPASTDLNYHNRLSTHHSCLIKLHRITTQHIQSFLPFPIRPTRSCLYISFPSLPEPIIPANPKVSFRTLPSHDAAFRSCHSPPMIPKSNNPASRFFFCHTCPALDLNSDFEHLLELRLQTKND